MRNAIGSLILGFMVLTALPAQAQAGWPCENGDWEWSWRLWEWGCSCDSGWETTPSPWVDQCTTYTNPSCNDHNNRYQYICTYSSGELSDYLKCDENDPNLRSKCWHYKPSDSWFSWANWSSPGEGWYYKTCPRTRVCSTKPYSFYGFQGASNPCRGLQFNRNSPEDRPCGAYNIQTY